MAMNKQRRTANLNNIVTYDTLKNVTLLADLTVEGLTGAGFVKADANGLLSVDTGAYLPMPSQTGNGGKYLTTDGVNLSWGTVSTANIYNSNGTLTGNRTVNLGSSILAFNGGNGVRIANSSTAAFGNQGSLMIGNPANNGALSFALSAIYFNGANGHHFTIATGLNDVTPTTFFQVRNSGRVLIGTTSEATYLLDVNGTARVSGLTTLASGDFLQTASSTATWFSDGNNPLRIVRTYALLNLDNSGTLTLASNLNVQRIFSTLNQDSGGTGIYTASITATVSGVNRNMNNLNRQVLQLTSTGGGSVVNGPKLSFLDISRGDATGFSSYVGIDVKDLDSYFGSTSGSVAIGSSATPAYRLDVTGTGRFTGALYSNTCVYATGNQSDGALNVSNPNTSGFNTVIINRADVTNCFGNIAFVDRKTGALGRGFSIGIGISGDPTWADGDFIIGNYTGTGGWTQSARIFNATGNWKIGSNTTDAGYKLDIVGTARVQLPAVGSSSYFVLSSASATTTNSYFGLTDTDVAFSRAQYSWGTNLRFNGTTFVRDTSAGAWMISQSCGNDVSNHFFRIRNINPNVGTLNSSTFVIAGNGNIGVDKDPASGIRLDVNGVVRGTEHAFIDSVGGSFTQYNIANVSGSLRLVVNDNASPIFYIRSGSDSNITFGSFTYYNTAQVAIDSTTKGFLPPRMTTTQKNAIATPAAGLMVFDNTLNKSSYYNGTTWVDGGDNIYNSNGTLTGNRTVTMGSFTLSFDKDISVNALTIGKGGGSIGTNTSIGINAIMSNTTGNNNTSIGYDSGKTNTTGVNNTYVGFSSGASNQNSRNTAVGYYAGGDNTSGTYNTALGHNALKPNTSGSYNIGIGGESGQGNTTGSYNIFIGLLTTALADNQTNQIVIGNQITGLGSNTTIIGTASTITTALRGRLLLGTTTDTGLYQLDVQGTSNFSNKLSVIATTTTNDVALFRSVEPYVTIEAVGASNPASIFFRPSTSAQNATIQNRTGGGIDLYTGITPSLSLAVKGSGAVVASSTLGMNGVEDSVKSGKYTPTLTNSTNVASSAVNSNVFKYIRVGSTVNVSGWLTITATTANALTELELSLPIASNITSNEDVSGVASTLSGGYGQVRENATNNTAKMYVQPTSTGNLVWYLEFSYVII